MKKRGKKNRSPQTVDTYDKPTTIVGIGASAGGLEAIEAFFKAMPVDSGMAFVIIQHLSPDYKSLMVELLSRKTEIPVHRAEDEIIVDANNIYLIPPKKNLTIFHGKLILEDQKHREGINLPVDVFLRSLAEDQGENAVAVILSGTGSDGTRGVRAVKERGGLVMVQDEASAKFDGMPRAAASTGVADFVLPPNEMPSQLVACLRHPYASRQERQQQAITDESGLTRLFSLLRTKTKVDFTYYKPNTITRRIERRIAVTQVADLDAYVRYAEQTPAEITALYRELLIGVTSFFRDPEVMTKLHESVLPDLLERTKNREIRFWVAGCSTGEEAYTLAILTREVMESLGIARDIKIFATDIDRDAVLKAGTGVYPESIAADLNPVLLAKYFYCRGETYHVARSVREMVVFAQHNLVKDPPFTRIDLVSCRNLLIYLQTNLQQRALEMFSFSLQSGGILLLGTSETVGDMEDCFVPVDRKLKIYRSQGKGRNIIDVNPLEISPKNERSLPLAVTGFRRSPRTGTREQERLLSRLLETLTDSYVPLTVVVNEQLEVLHTLGKTTGIFTLPSGRALLDISKMVNRELAIPLTTGIQKVFRTGEELVYSNVRLHESDITRTMRLRIRLLPGRKSDEALTVIFFERIEDIHPSTEDTVAEYDLDEETGLRLQDLEQELQFTRENLQATIEELETSNEELQATNEELLASNEELQSTNEELQSANEELYTVNTEYQNKILELTEVRNDVDNLLSTSNIGIVILDEDLCIRRYSPQAAEVFNLVESDLGRPLTHLSHRIVDADPVEMVRATQNNSEPIEREVSTDDDHWHLIRVLPYHIGPQTVAGVVITLIDVTTLHEARERLESARHNAADIIFHMPAGLFLYDVTKTDEIILKSGNPAAETSTGLTLKDCIGRRFEDLWPGKQGSELKTSLLGAFRENKPFYEPEYYYSDNRLDGCYHIHAFRLPGDQLAVSFEDITERKRTENALKESELRYRILADNGQALIWTSGLDSKCDYFNKVWLKFTGRTLEQELGDGWTEGVHPEDLNRCVQTYISAFDKRDSFSMTYRLRRHDGEYRWIVDDGTPRYDDDGNFIGFIGHCLDITDQVRAEEARRESDERYRVLYHLLADAEKTIRMGSWTWDVANDSVTWSENLFELFRRDPALGAPSFEKHDVLYTPESMARLLKAVEGTLNTGTGYELKLEAVRADGSIMPCIVRGQAYKDSNGSVHRLYGSLQEIPT